MPIAEKTEAWTDGAGRLFWTKEEAQASAARADLLEECKVFCRSCYCIEREGDAETLMRWLEEPNIFEILHDLNNALTRYRKFRASAEAAQKERE